MKANVQQQIEKKFAKINENLKANREAEIENFKKYPEDIWNEKQSNTIYSLKAEMETRIKLRIVGPLLTKVSSDQYTDFSFLVNDLALIIHNSMRRSTSNNQVEDALYEIEKEATIDICQELLEESSRIVLLDTLN